jgi:hypothetical protein
MTPHVEHLGEQRFLMSVTEKQLPFGLDGDYHRPAGTETLASLAQTLRSAEYRMMYRVKDALLAETRAGEFLRELPKRSTWKRAFVDERDDGEYEIGFIVTFRNRGHAALFKLSFCDGRAAAHV